MKRTQKRLYSLVFTFILILLFLTSESAAAKLSDITFSETASDLMISALKPESDKHFLKQLYTQLFYIPIWIKKDKPTLVSRDLFDIIKADKSLERTSNLYQNMLSLEEEMYGLYTYPSSIVQKVNWEFKMSQLYEEYANYVIYGSINWGAFQARLSNLRVSAITAGWITYKPDYSPLKIAEHAVLLGSLKKAFKEAEPDKYRYKELRKALDRYIDIRENGGWPYVNLKGTLKPGRTHPSVPFIREHLLITGDYIPCDDSDESSLYDACLKKAVIRFQKRNGLVSQGVIGKNTVKSLNRTVDDRIATIKINLDRIKWLHKRPDHRHIIINIPDFRLYYEENGELKMTMKVIVGKRKNPTPIFSNRVKSVVLNPYWNVPKSIIQKEMIPKLLRNPHAMAGQGIDIYTGWGSDAKKVSGGSVNWAQYRYSKTVPFRFAQRPGNRNALGRIKFLFPNQFHVYMHDTPTKHLFKRHKRSYSHGCIRLEKPRLMMETIASFNPSLELNKANKILKSKKNTYFSLENTVPIDVVYLTAWIGYDGQLQFRDDVYKYDELMIASVRKW
jgi:murein L,D-transpeptidase YcbB/YkuD